MGRPGLRSFDLAFVAGAAVLDWGSSQKMGTAGILKVLQPRISGDRLLALRYRTELLSQTANARKQWDIVSLEGKPSDDGKNAYGRTDLISSTHSALFFRATFGIS